MWRSSPFLLKNSRDGAHQLNDVSQVVLVSGVVFAAVRLKQVVTCGQLKGHASRRPDVGRGSVPGAEEDLEASILPGLDVLCKVVHDPARVAQVGYLNL
jgi:hypothetical protein